VGLIQQLKRAGRLTGILAQELRAAAALSPFGVRAVRVRRCVDREISSKRVHVWLVGRAAEYLCTVECGRGLGAVVACTHVSRSSGAPTHTGTGA
jgi:hypothetical protein